ncbi:MAG: DUF2313 domain-containing protein [SAR202 cluster bacterium]|nr:DUF2313 domain-containing protein [SAR202 cluster bacterium]
MVTALQERPALDGPSSYLKYLPAIYSESEFMGRFLLIFESILGPLESVVDNLAYYFDPDTTPEELLPWLASWLKIVLDESWPLARRREFVRAAPRLFQWRGTRRGLKEMLRLATGVEPAIVENFGTLTLGPQSLLGRNTLLGNGQPHTFSVTLKVDAPSQVNAALVKAIIEMEKPAHTAYSLQIMAADAAIPA